MLSSSNTLTKKINLVSMKSECSWKPQLEFLYPYFKPFLINCQMRVSPFFWINVPPLFCILTKCVHSFISKCTHSNETKDESRRRHKAIYSKEISLTILLFGDLLFKDYLLHDWPAISATTDNYDLLRFRYHSAFACGGSGVFHTAFVIHCDFIDGTSTERVRHDVDI